MEEKANACVDVREAVEYFIQNIHTDNIAANCMFVDQNSQRKKVYIGYNLNCDLEMISGAAESSLKSVQGILKESEIRKFDFEFGEDGVIQTLKRDEVAYTDEILNELSIELNEKNIMNAERKIDNLDFVVIQMVSSADSVGDLILFKKYIKAGTAFKKSVKMVFEGSVPKVIKEDIVTIGDNVDAVLYDGTYYVLNRRGFDSIFSYREGFKRIVAEGRQGIKNSGMFSDTDKFINDCVKDGRYLPRLAKTIASGCFGEVAKKIGNLAKIKATHGVKLSLTPDNKIAYTGEEDIPEILNLLLDHYVVSPMTDRAMLAKAIEKYSM